MRRHLGIVVMGQRGAIDPATIPFPVYSLGYVSDEARAAMAYAAADVLAAPSRHDNLPNTVLESLACSTPAAAFRIGGMPDMIDHEACGCLVEPFDTGAYARALVWLIEDTERQRRLAIAARDRAVTRFSLEAQARAYVDVYETILGHPLPIEERE